MWPAQLLEPIHYIGRRVTFGDLIAGCCDCDFPRDGKLSPFRSDSIAAVFSANEAARAPHSQAVGVLGNFKGDPRNRSTGRLELATAEFQELNYGIVLNNLAMRLHRPSDDFDWSHKFNPRTLLGPWAPWW